MRPFPSLLVAILSATPLYANAVPVSVEYTGQVTGDGGLGPIFGATVAGTLTYDTDQLGVDVDPGPSVSLFGPGQFTSGYVPSGAPGFGKDFLFLWDQAYGGVLDRFEIGDEYEYATDDGAGNTYNLQEGIRLTASASDALQNFVVGSDPLQTFTLTNADGLAELSAFLFRQEIRTVNHETTLFSFQYAIVSLEALSVVSVPEPATMLLLATGLVGVAATRRRRRAVN